LDVVLTADWVKDYIGFSRVVNAATSVISFLIDGGEIHVCLYFCL